MTPLSVLPVALKRPVTITSGDNQFVVLERARVHELYLGRYYLELAVKIDNAITHNIKDPSLYWLEYLDTKERKLFQKELIQHLMASITTGRWNNVDELIEDWKATVETENDPAAIQAITSKISKDDFVTV
jgi:hypothetical protein